MDEMSLEIRLLMDPKSYLLEAPWIEAETTFEGISPCEMANVKSHEFIRVAHGVAMGEQVLKEPAILYSVLYLHKIKAKVS